VRMGELTLFEQVWFWGHVAWLVVYLITGLVIMPVTFWLSERTVRKARDD